MTGYRKCWIDGEGTVALDFGAKWRGPPSRNAEAGITWVHLNPFRDESSHSLRIRNESGKAT